MNVLGIETSCDETAVAVVRDGREVLSNIVASQDAVHAPFGGIVPELASRQHLLAIVPVIKQALADAPVSFNKIDAVAITHGPGLAGSLIVGVNVAKALAYTLGIPLLGVNHLEGHIYANWLTLLGQEPPPEPLFPSVALVVSGGHSELVLLRGRGAYTRLGRTRDDAAGEAFDKVARMLGLGFPGGPAIQRAAQAGDSERFPLPRTVIKGSLDVSFSGLKTAVARSVAAWKQAEPLPVADLASSFQRSVVEILLEKTRIAVERYRAREVLLGGGVATNALLRQWAQERLPVPVRCPPLSLCTDNGAMIAGAAFPKLGAGHRSDWTLDVVPNLGLGG
ncbi:MAG: tRNA (adenosine(37)-N6)-threonylcarbamoyltransferase complex transferase subunit TsaD [Chloroflexi bacterium]|nr:tRNA (adenosine(37)-N6)-threonylcarbamoyltransferase complex transferase subunit TsaD [Chloroflexota bacterium]